jgi:SSS family solute:Na+ symporter
VLATSIVAVTYTSLGGLRAVVITDFAQTVLLFGGAILVLVTISIRMGGVGWFPTEWHPIWDTQPIFSTNLATRVTVVGSILNVLVWYVCTTGGDQTSIQRFMATSDTRSARIALATQLAVSVIVGVTLGMVGFALLGYFEANPHLLEGMSLKDDADKIFPRFIAFHLPVGVSGLVVAAMFAAAMSSIDSGVNSITAVVMTDFLDRFGLSPTSDQKHVRASRLLAISIGVIVVLCSSMMQSIPGNITAVTSKTSNLLTTPIFCLFFFALFVRFATPLGAWIGAFFGTMTAILIAFSGPLVVMVATYFQVDPELYGVVIEIDKSTGEKKIIDPISFQYIAPAAVLVNLATGSIASLLTRGKTKNTE